MITRHRLYAITEAVLLWLSGLITLLLAVRPEWGHGPNDFYLGYPYRFYITQSDVAYPYVSVLWCIFDVALFGVPVLAATFVILYGLHRLLIPKKQGQNIDNQ